MLQQYSGKKDCKLILITGPSSSGKTTFANRLSEELKKHGLSTLNISLDDYYKPIDEIPPGDDGKPDLEDIEAFEYDILNEHITHLIAGNSVYMPYYDFEKRMKIREGKLISLKDDEIILVEGIQALNPKIANSIDADKKYKIYCSALNALKNKNGDRIKSEITRLMRRLVRDYYFRNADYKLTFDLWDKVEIGSEKNIYPFTGEADTIFNSAAFYEYNLYKKHLAEILKDAVNDSNYTEKTKILLDTTEEFESLEDFVVPQYSIVKEFIG